jgi:poly(A) polymerase
LRCGENAGEDNVDWRPDFNPDADKNRLLMDASLILSRYDVSGKSMSAEFLSLVENSGEEKIHPRRETLLPETQRILLTSLLLSPRPDRGFELLKESGFLASYWPEIALLDDAEHSKEFHPEGNAWKHTMETFRYRKPGTGGAHDLLLSLGLLLHDTGKPLSESYGGRRFDGHAELGALTARRFLQRLEFPPSLIADTAYLVRNHMLPAALPHLPLSRTEEIMSSPLFPALMELYRCDESSSFKGLDQYYKSSAAYQNFLRHRRNPYRSADGKKLGNIRRK